MKIEQIKAYKSNDGCIWETEKEALEQNIDQAIDDFVQLDSPHHANNRTALKEFFHQHKKQVKYILANIDKIMK